MRGRTRDESGGPGRKGSGEDKEHLVWAPGLVSPTQPAAPAAAWSCPQLQVPPPLYPHPQLKSSLEAHGPGSSGKVGLVGNVFFKNPLHIRTGIPGF